MASISADNATTVAKLISSEKEEFLDQYELFGISKIVKTAFSRVYLVVYTLATEIYRQLDNSFG